MVLVFLALVLLGAVTLAWAMGDDGGDAEASAAVSATDARDAA